MPFNENLKKIREQKCMTQEQLSKASGVGRITISRIETGKLTDSTLLTVRKLAAGLEVDERDLFDG